MKTLALPSEVLSRLPPQVEFVSLFGDRLILRMTTSMHTASRGHMLLELEKRLHREVSPKMEVFLEPRGDMEKLRVRLRGVTVK